MKWDTRGKEHKFIENIVIRKGKRYDSVYLARDVNLKKIKKTMYNEEFDPGSGWTLAAGLTHASRGVTGVACYLLTTGARVRNAYTIYLLLRDSPEKFGLRPHGI